VLKTLFNFHGYMFNKAHSASYALQAFQGAWLKARYPAQYMAAMLSQHRGFYTPLFYALESLRLGLEFRGPCVNASRTDYRAEVSASPGFAANVGRAKAPAEPPCCDRTSSRPPWQRGVDPANDCSGAVGEPIESQGEQLPGSAGAVALPACARGNSYRAIRVPLPVIKDISQATFDRWERAREQGEFTDLRDFLWRVRPHPAETERLIQAGALDCLGLSRSELFWRARFYAQKQPADDNLELDLGGDDPPELPENLDLTEPDAQTRARWENELWGFPVSRHPLEFFGDTVDWGSYCPARDAGKFPGRTVRVCGLIVATRLNHTLKGQLMSFLTLADFSGFVETTLFPKIYRRFGYLGEMHKVIAITGTVEPFDNGRGFIIDVKKIEEARKRSPNEQNE
jgi:DNA polymerase III alpha subunit